MKNFTDLLRQAEAHLQRARSRIGAALGHLVPDKHTVAKSIIVLAIGLYALCQPYTLKYIAPFFGISIAVLIAIKTRRFLLALLSMPVCTALVLVPYWALYRLAIPSVYMATLTTYNNTELGLIQVWSLLTVAGFLLSLVITRFATVRKAFFLSITWLLLVITGGAAWFANANEELRTWQLATYVSSNVEVLQHIPPTINRMMPQISAKGQINLDNRSNLYVPADKPHLSPGLDGQMYWCSPLYYKESLLYNFLGMVKDVICIDANKTDMEAAATTLASIGQDGVQEIVARIFGVFHDKPGDGFFWISDRSFIANAVLKLRHPFSTKDRVIYTYAPDGSRHYLMTYVSKCPYVMGAMLPCVGGVLDVSTSGWMRDLSIKEVEQLYPQAVVISPDFAATLIKAYAQFYTGLISKQFNQQSNGVMQMSLEERQKELAPEDYNPAPYITEFKRDLRPQQMASLEPAGTKDGKALTALVMVDNYGHLRIFEPKAGGGPAMAMTYAHNADPRVDWGHKILAEDRHVIGENDHIYWLVSVVNDNPRHPLYISSLVDSIKFNATAVHSARELDQVLKQFDGQPDGASAIQAVPPDASATAPNAGQPDASLTAPIAVQPIASATAPIPAQPSAISPNAVAGDAGSHAATN